MKKLILIASISIGFVLPQSVFADSKFDGFYAGVQVGYVYGKDKGQEYIDGVANKYTQITTLNSLLIGGFVGFNKVLENNMLVGIETDYEYRGGSDKSFQKDEGVPDLDYPIKTKLKDTGSLRARLGYLFNEDKTLGYLTAGYATANVKRTFSYLSADSESHSKWHDGWTAGFGAEHLVSEKISVKAEYRYSDYGRETISAAQVYGDGYEEKTKYQDEQSFRIGVAYHF